MTSAEWIAAAIQPEWGHCCALDERTVTDYLQALEQLMVIEDQPAWAPHLRSRARLRSDCWRILNGSGSCSNHS